MKEAYETFNPWMKTDEILLLYSKENEERIKRFKQNAKITVIEHTHIDEGTKYWIIKTQRDATPSDIRDLRGEN